MDRRRFLELTAIGSGALAGCGEQPSHSGRERTTGTGTGTSVSQTATTSSETTGYERQFKPLEEPPWDLGASYSFIDKNAWDCIDGAPTYGTYPATSNPTTVNQQLDHLLSVGIGRVVFRYESPGHRAALSRFFDAELASEVRYEVAYPLKRAVDAGWDVESDFAFLADHLAQDRYATVGARPVFTLRGFDDFLAPGEEAEHARERLPAADLVEFLNDLSARLGTASVAPYLVADLGQAKTREFTTHLHSNHAEVFDSVDAVTNRYRPPDDAVLPWASAFTYDRRIYESLAEFANSLSLDFIPSVYPGLDRSVFTCSDSTVRIPRSPGQLEVLIRYASQYATTDRIRIDSFNDWRNGTQIEPGRVHGTEYGRAFLERVHAFLQDGPTPGSATTTVHHISPTGSDANLGRKHDPLATITEGLRRAQPGDTIYVQPGEYREAVRTIRSGEPGKPITVTGPKTAVLRPPSFTNLLRISHSHVHLTGLTLNGLIDPDTPDDPESYGPTLLLSTPLPSTDKYVTDVKLMPKAIGNCIQNMIKVTRSAHVEIGAFEIIGVGGADFTVGEAADHNGEVVYVGTTEGVSEQEWYTWETKDETNNVHVHHIDNSAGHPHGDFVAFEPETHDCLLEYCTDRNAGHATDGSWNPAVVLAGYDSTVRYCDIAATSWPILFDGVRTEDQPRNNNVYFNRLHDYEAQAVGFQSAEKSNPGRQGVICGNDVDGPTAANASQQCPADIPSGNGIGHLGGDSPWT